MNLRLLRLARESRGALVLTILAGLFTGWLTIAQARGISLVADAIFLDSQGWGDVKSVMVFLVGVIVFRAFLAWLTEVSAARVAIAVKRTLRSLLFAKVQALGPAFLRHERTGELTTAASEGVETLDAYFSQYLPQLVITALVPLSILVFVFPLDPLSGVVLLVTAPLIPLFMVLIGKGAEKETHRQFDLLGRLAAHFLDSLQGLITLKELGRSREHVEEISKVSNRYREITLKVLRITFLSALALELIATISTAVVAVEVGLRLLYGRMEFVNALFLLMLAPEFYLPLRMLGLRFHAGMAGVTAARRIFEVLDLEEPSCGTDSIKDPQQGKSEEANHLIATSPRTLHLEGITFTYPGETSPALVDVDLKLREGEHIALVGSSGAGKSSLAALLLRFYEPQAGRLCLNGSPAKKVPVEDWRKLFTWVPQHPHLFHDSIAANLRVARSKASMDELELAVQAAHLGDFIHGLPEGFATVIGEGGMRLSGGQAQRLALARAFLKEAPYLILDEPTSWIDPHVEIQLEESTRRLMKGRTVLTIAHRMNTITGADRIYVLEQGRIVEAGTLEELQAHRGVFQRMITARQLNPAVGLKAAIGTRVERPGDQIDGWQIPSTLVGKKADRIKPSLMRLLYFLNGSWPGIFLSLVLGVITILSSVGLMGTSSWLIATAALHPSIAELNLAIVGVRFFGLLRGVTRYAERLVSHSVTLSLLARLRTWFFARLEPLFPARLTGFKSGDLLQRIVADVDILENFYIRAVSPPMVALIIAVATSIFLASYSNLLGWLYVGAALLVGLVVPVLSFALTRRSGEALVGQRADLRILTVDLLQGLADLLVFGALREKLQAVREFENDHGRTQRHIARMTGLSAAASVLFSNLGMWAVLAISIGLVTSGQLDGVMLVVLPLIAQASFEAVLPLPPAFQMLSASLTSAGRLFEVVDRGEAGTARSETPQRKRVAGVPELRIRGLTFSYPGQTHPALQDLDLDMPEGKKMAVVGPNGSGKTTLINLLLRFWQAPRGCIFVGGEDLLDMTDEEARSFFSVISQRTHLFNASIRDNLLLADAFASDEAIKAVIRAAELDGWIESLPNGTATMTGERGFRLSGGERQRLAIARSLLKKSPILICDEPTANLDPITGQAVLHNLLAIARDRSVLLITHQVEGLEAMDEIVVLADGRVVERGTQASLLKRDGLFREMVQLKRRILVDPE